MSDRVLDDRRAREIVRGPETVSGPLSEGGAFAADRCLVVRAGAGSGKTRALVERMVALVRAGVPLRNIAAITFTVRAAGEMRERFHATLRESLRDVDRLLDGQPGLLLEVERDRLREAFGRSDDLFVDTIHAFCRTMLAERPFEAGVPPDFRQVDDREEAELRRRYWHDVLDRELRQGDRPAAWWMEAGVDPADLAEFFGLRCTHEDLPLAQGRQDCPDLAAAVERAAAWLDGVLPGTPSPGVDRDRLGDTLHRMDRHRSLIGFGTRGSMAAFLEMLDGLVREDGSLKNDVLKVGRWKARGAATLALMESLRGKAVDPVVAPLGEIVLREVRPVLEAWREYLFGEIGDFVDDAVTGYRRFRCDEGLLTFQDLLLRAADLLRSSPAARRHFRSRYTHLLVDEFQDTDPVQAEVVFLLTGTDEENTDWTRARPGPGSLFLVGDDKQSIYRFRRADVQVYRRAGEIVEAAGGESVRFVTNFRSESRICAWVNRAVRPVFADEPPYQAPWEDLHPFEGPGTTPHPVVALDLDREPRHSGRLVARQEAERIAEVIRRLVHGREVPTSAGEPVRLEPAAVAAGDIMVLVRSATHAAEYARALDAAAIPFVASGGKALGKEPVVAALLDLLESALNPDDPVVLAAVLRGPMVGASDEDLRRFRAAGGRFSVVSDGQPPSALEACAAVRDGIRLVDAARRLFRERPLGEAVARLLDAEGLLSAVAIRRNGSSAAGALVRILAMAREIDGRGGGWAEMMDELRRLVSGELEAEAQTLEAGGAAVRIMTVHQAKGLQARVVFLAYPLPPRDHPVDFHVDRSAAEPRLFLPCRKGGVEIARPVDWIAAETEARRFEEAEEQRLVYVAATRARELLVVSRYAGKSGGPWQALGSGLEDVPSIAFAGLSGEPAEGEQSIVSHKEMMDSLARTHAAIEDSLHPTWRHESVTGAAADGESAPDPFEVETEGLGRGFGRAVHRLFQFVVERRYAVPDRDRMRAVAHRLVREEAGRASPDLAGRAVEVVDAFVGGPLWPEILSAGRVLCETPFIRRLDGSPPVICTGVIDLLYRVATGWVLVDFKTESADGERLRERHGAQLGAYRTHWEALSGEPVVRTLIWPAVPGAGAPVDCPE